MKTIIILLLTFLFISCNDDYAERDNFCYVVGAMKCYDNFVYYCDHDNIWREDRDCTAIGLTCIYNQPELQGGFIRVATCE